MQATSFGNISYLYRNGKIPFYFLHGLGGTGNTWLKLARFLKPELELFFIDLLGHGRSDKPVDHLTIEDQCAMLDEFLMNSSAGEYGLVGNSYGGWIALRYTISRERQPGYLVLVDSAGLPTAIGNQSQPMNARYILNAIAMSNHNEEHIIRTIVEANQAPGERLTESELGSIKSRTLILWGERDSLIPVDRATTLHRCIPQSSLHVLTGAGHVPQTTHPRELASLINDFVQ